MRHQGETWRQPPAPHSAAGSSGPPPIVFWKIAVTPHAVRPEEQAIAVGGPRWKPVGGRIGRQARGGATGEPQHPEIWLRRCGICHSTATFFDRATGAEPYKRRIWVGDLVDAPLRSRQRRLVVSPILGLWASTPDGDAATAA